MRFIQPIKSKKNENQLNVPSQIVKTELIKENESISLKILFYVRQPPVGPVSGAKVETLYKTLPESKLWEYTEREALGYPKALEQSGKNTGASRTISIIAFVLGWVRITFFDHTFNLSVNLTRC